MKYYNHNKKFDTVVNLGSGNIKHLELTKPWVNHNIFSMLKDKKAKIIHVDSSKHPGVDIIRDLRLPNALDFTHALKKPTLFILANVLEHIPSKSRQTLLNNIYAHMKINDGLLITVPYDYPYHADPIDSMYRPNPEELKKLIPIIWHDGLVITAGSYRDEFLNRNYFERLRKLLKPFWPFQSIKKYLGNHRLLYLFKPYKITIVFGIK